MRRSVVATIIVAVVVLVLLYVAIQIAGSPAAVAQAVHLSSA